MLGYDDITENYTVAMGSKLYRLETGVFHCSAIKKYHENDDTRFPGRSHNRPPPVMTHENEEWEVEGVEDHRKHYGKDQFLIKWERIPGH